MKSHENNDPLATIRALCNNQITFSTRMSLLSFYKIHFPKIIEQLILILDYLQLFAQALIANNYFYDTSAISFNTLLNNLLPIARVISPGHLLPFDDDHNAIILIVLLILFLYLIFKYVLAAYIILVTSRNLIPNMSLLRIWQGIFQLHGRILYYLVSSFWVNLALAASEDRYRPFGLSSPVVVTISIIIMIMELFFALCINVRFEYILPSKSFLASKSNRGELISLLQKFILQIFEIALDANKWTNAMIYCAFSFVLSIGNLVDFFISLPLYNLKALALEACLLIELAWLSFLFLLRVAIDKGSDLILTIDGAVLMFLVTSPILAKISLNFVQGLVNRLISKEPRGRSPELVHKISAIKQIRKRQKPLTEFSDQLDWAHLMHTTYNKSTEAVFGIEVGSSLVNSSSNKRFDCSSKASMNRVFMKYLEKLSGKFPQNEYLKLYIAFYHGKKFKNYGAALKILYELKKSFSSKINLNACLLIVELQDLINKAYETESNKIDLSGYVRNLALVNRLKEDILKQVDSQIKVCQEFSQNISNLAKIFNLAQEIGAGRKLISKKAQRTFATLPDYHIELYTLYARYELLMNHSLVDYMEKSKIYARLYQKHAKLFHTDIICQENIYHKDVSFVVVCAQGSQVGSVAYNSKSSEQLFGGPLFGSNAFTLVPPVLQKYYFEFFKDPLSSKYDDVVGNTMRTFGYHRKGNIFEMSIYLNIHPFLNQGLFYNLIMRSTQSTKEYIIITKEGFIDSFSKKIGIKLNLANHQVVGNKLDVKIGVLSKGLKKLNEACDLVAFENFASGSLKTDESTGRTTTNEGLTNLISLDKTAKNVTDKAMKLKEAKLLYSKFSTDGRNIALNALQGRRTSNIIFEDSEVVHNHLCKIEYKFIGDVYLKILTLEPPNQSEEDEPFDDVNVLMRKATSGKTQTLDPTLTTAKTLFKELTHKGKKSMSGDQSNVDASSVIAARSENLLTMEGEERVRPNDELDSPGFDQTIKIFQFPPPNDEEAGTSSETESKIKKDVEKTASKTGGTPNDSKQQGVLQIQNVVEDPAVAGLQIVQHSLGSTLSKSSAQGRVSKALKEAMTILYYPTYYKYFIFFFYVLLGSIFGSQLYLKLAMNSDLNIREARKDIIRNAELRNDLLVSIQRYMRYLSDVITGRLVGDELGLYDQPVSYFVTLIRADLSELSDINAELVSATADLQEEYREDLFLANVRIYESDYGDAEQIYYEMNNFQATNEIVEAGLKVVELAESDPDKALEYAQFIFRNSLNDLLLRSIEISTLFVTSLERQNNDILDQFFLAFTAGLVLCAAVIAYSVLVIGAQYQTEKRNMYIFTRLSQHRIKGYQTDLVRFKRVLQDNQDGEESINLDTLPHGKSLNSTKQGGFDAKDVKKLRMGSHIQQPSNHQGIFNKYLVHVMKMVTLILVIMGMLVLHYQIEINGLDDIHSKLNQLYFTDSLRSTLNRALYTSQELLIMNTTTLILNQSPLVRLEEALDEIKELRTEITNEFTSVDSEYSDLISEIIFTDGCQYLSGFSKQGCEVLSGINTKLSVMDTSSALDLGVSERYRRYMSSDKSYAALKEIQVSTFLSAVAPNIVLSEETTLISTLLNTGYDSEIDKIKERSDIVWAAVCIVMLCVAVTAWFIVLKKVRNTDSEFKNVLQTVPPSIVLANFMLKAYLLRTTKGTLEFVRNDI